MFCVIILCGGGGWGGTHTHTSSLLPPCTRTLYCPFYGAQQLQLAGGPASSGPQLLRETPHPMAVQVDQHGAYAQSARGKADEGVKGDRLAAGRMQAELDHARMVSAVRTHWGPAMLSVHM